MTSPMGPLQLFDYYLSLGIDQTLNPKVVRHRKAKLESLTAREHTTPKAPAHENPSSSPINLEGINSLEDLQKALESFQGCALKDTALHTVFSDGNPESSIMLIGEAPGADEDRLGKPFVGLSGQLLDQIIGTLGLNRRHVYITNIIPWRPPGNRPPTLEETRACLPFVKKHIALINPKILIFVGGTAAKTLLHTQEGITKLRGRWVDYSGQEGHLIPSLALYHPDYLLRYPSKKKVVWQDMLLLMMRLMM
jgi:uracil-DNA glycosylase family 4